MPKAQWNRFNPAWCEAYVDNRHFRLVASEIGWTVQERDEVVSGTAGRSLSQRVEHTCPRQDIVTSMEQYEAALVQLCEERAARWRTLQP